MPAVKRRTHVDYAALGRQIRGCHIPVYVSCITYTHATPDNGTRGTQPTCSGCSSKRGAAQMVEATCARDATCQWEVTQPRHKLHGTPSKAVDARHTLAQRRTHCMT
jgi:hypothetical protein